MSLYDSFTPYLLPRMAPTQQDQLREAPKREADKPRPYSLALENEEWSRHTMRGYKSNSTKSLICLGWGQISLCPTLQVRQVVMCGWQV